MKKLTRLINLILGPALFAAVSLLLPKQIFTTPEARIAVASITWIGYWWITLPVDFAVTALLPLAINAFFLVADMGSVLSQYASETIVLLFGASVLSVSWEETGLDKRIALTFLNLVGNRLPAQLVFWFLLSTFMSSILPNAVVVAILIPIAVSMLRYAGEGDIPNSSVGSLVLIIIAWGAGLGGLATPLGGAMNLVVVSYLEQVTGAEYIYINWVIRFLPIMAVLILTNLIYILLIMPKQRTLSGSGEFAAQMKAGMLKMNRDEIICLALFCIATVAAFTRQLYAPHLPGLKPAYVYIVCAILSFLIKKSDGTQVMRWSRVQGKISWELLLLFAGGLAVGKMLTGSGADSMLAAAIQNSGINNTFLLVFVIVAFTLVLSDVTSNTATAAISMPIVLSMTKALNLNPIPYIYVATIGVNLSYSLPTSIRAVPIGYGVPPKLMLKRGAILSVFVIILMTALGYLLIEYWPAFSTA
ncbi:MAG TPA: Di-and tricarboxylate transporter [Clostridiales bacterium]|nr:Di-and tricarboxylate transporter [Clostridiales bacterium]HBR09014.1 Di-and tricarboxylate transporter [Clostridiales bacterium]